MEHNQNINNMSSSQDEISLFLHQILLRSSSSSSMPAGSVNSNPLQDGKISALDSTSRPNHASSSVGGGLSGNDTDEYDCESEVLYYYYYFLLFKFQTFFLCVHVFVVFLLWDS